jgi:hypothetical protein
MDEEHQKIATREERDQIEVLLLQSQAELKKAKGLNLDLLLNVDELDLERQRNRDISSVIIFSYTLPCYKRTDILPSTLLETGIRIETQIRFGTQTQTNAK